MKKRCFIYLACMMLLILGIAAADNTVKTGDEILFGSYEQDNNIQKGKEPITWVVVDKKQSYHDSRFQISAGLHTI